MARKRAACRKYHGPRRIGAPAQQLAVDEVGNAAEEQPDRSGRAGDIAERENGNSAMTREQHAGQHAAEKAAVKRHAAVPELENFNGMRGEIAWVVEQHVADAPAENDAERHP